MLNGERRLSLDCSHISGKIYIKSRCRADRKDLEGEGRENEAYRISGDRKWNTVTF